MTNSPYNILLSLPLFAGMGKEELLSIAARFRLDFRKYSAGDRMVKCGERCLELIFVTCGDVQLKRHSSSRKYYIEESFHAPLLIQPERLYGLQQCFTVDVYALTDCNVLSIDKKTVGRICDCSMAFKFNFLNRISTCQQRLVDDIWNDESYDTLMSVKHFLMTHSSQQAFSSVLHITMRQLSEEIKEQRIFVSKALNEMKNAALIKLYRGRIEYCAKELLL